MRTRKDQGYTIYKEALHSANIEIRQSKISYEQTFACNINKVGRFNI